MISMDPEPEVAAPTSLRFQLLAMCIFSSNNNQGISLSWKPTRLRRPKLERPCFRWPVSEAAQLLFTSGAAVAVTAAGVRAEASLIRASDILSFDTEFPFLMYDDNVRQGALSSNCCAHARYLLVPSDHIASDVRHPGCIVIPRTRSS